MTCPLPVRPTRCADFKVLSRAPDHERKGSKQRSYDHAEHIQASTTAAKRSMRKRVHMCTDAAAFATMLPCVVAPPSAHDESDAVPLEGDSIEPKGSVTAVGRLTAGGDVMWYEAEDASKSVVLLQDLLGSTGTEARPTGVVIILRGLPGSGKSTLRRRLASSLEQTGSFAHISADSFFEQGAGVVRTKKAKTLSADECYALAFKKKLLPKAHEYARNCFTEALAEGASVICVDNTASMLSEYSFYREQGEAAG